MRLLRPMSEEDLEAAKAPLQYIGESGELSAWKREAESGSQAPVPDQLLAETGPEPRYRQERAARGVLRGYRLRQPGVQGGRP